MKYELVQAHQKRYIMINEQSERIQGRGLVVRHPGLYLDFKGRPPVLDTREIAEKHVDWEERRGKLAKDIGDRHKERERAIRKLDMEIQSFIENLEDYTMRPPRIFRSLTPEERKELRPFSCPNCVADNPDAPPIRGISNFRQHMQEEHGMTMSDGG